MENKIVMRDSPEAAQYRKAEELIGDLLIDRRDVLDADDFELEDFMIAEDGE